MHLLRLSINVLVLGLCWALWVTRGKIKTAFRDMNDRFTTTINKVHVHKNQTSLCTILLYNIKKRKNKSWGLSTIVTGQLIFLIYSSPAFVLYIEHLSNWCQRKGERRDIRCSPGRHPNTQTFALHLKVIKKGWKYIHYKVMMKFPTGSLERQCFQ